MNAKPKRKKMCWNCEGNVNVDAEKCPYCQAALFPQTDNDSSQKNTHFVPPYNGFGQSSIPRSPFSYHSSSEDTQTDEEAEKGEENSKKALPSGAKQIVITMAMLMGGFVFFLFSWLLLLFSSHGYLVLRWNDAYWLVYLGIGIILLFLGFRNLNTIDDDLS